MEEVVDDVGGGGGTGGEGVDEVVEVVVEEGGGGRDLCRRWMRRGRRMMTRTRRYRYTQVKTGDILSDSESSDQNQFGNSHMDITFGNI